jgi:ribosomal protein S18 acetylase RimI-like enzyme
MHRASAAPSTVAVRLSAMQWETSLLRRPLARVQGVEAIGDPAEAAEALRRIEHEAAASGFELLVARVDLECRSAVWALEAAGFRTVDVGLTFEYDLRIAGPVHAAMPEGIALREATLDDVEPLEEAITGLFLHSYYYVCPWFSREEADMLFRAWIANCVRGVRGEQVLLATLGGAIAGFITRRAAGKGVGVIDLVGVVPGCASRGIGKLLVRAALDSFRDRGDEIVRVRTQAANLAAATVYASTRARLFAVDTTLVKPLAGRRTPTR